MCAIDRCHFHRAHKAELEAMKAKREAKDTKAKEAAKRKLVKTVISTKRKGRM